MKITIPRKFKKVMGKKEPAMQASIVAAIQQLADDIEYPGLRVHKMQGHAGVWEAYIDRSNRITFHYGEDGIVLRNNCNHDMLRRNP